MQKIHSEKLKIHGHFPMILDEFHEAQWKGQKGQVQWYTEMPGNEGPTGHGWIGKLNLLCFKTA